MKKLWNDHEDIRSLKSLVLFGLKGMAAYAYHARVLGKTCREVDQFFYEALYHLGEDEPQEVFDVFTSSLPRGEAERIYKGITVEGDEALQKLIEDFTG